MLPHPLAPRFRKGPFHQRLCLIFVIQQKQCFRLAFESHEWSADIFIAVGNGNRPIKKNHAFGRAVEPIQSVPDDFQIPNLGSNVAIAYRGQ